MTIPFLEEGSEEISVEHTHSGSICIPTTNTWMRNLLENKPKIDLVGSSKMPYFLHRILFRGVQNSNFRDLSV